MARNNEATERTDEMFGELDFLIHSVCSFMQGAKEDCLHLWLRLSFGYVRFETTRTALTYAGTLGLLHPYRTESWTAPVLESRHDLVLNPHRVHSEEEIRIMKLLECSPLGTFGAYGLAFEVAGSGISRHLRLPHPLCI